MKRILTYSTIISLIGICLVLVGCGGGSIGNNQQEFDQTYLGPWNGLIDGPGGQDKLSMSLAQDGTLVASGTKAFYTLTLGTWSANGSNFRATVNSGNLVITLKATILKDSIAGTWSGDNGTSGTFSVSRPPEVGTWTGSVNGSGGFAELTLILNKNGTMSTQTNSSFYSPLSGTWDETDSQLSATASGGGIRVNFGAAIQGNSMAGTWSGSNGTAGTFAAEKK